MKQVTDEDVIATLQQVEVPEPSPLFWEHLSQRVHDAVAAEPVPKRTWFGHVNAIWGLGTAAAIAVLVLAVVTSIEHSAPRSIPAPSTEEPAEVTPSAALPDDASWAVMDELASQLDFDEASAAGLGVRPGASDEAVAQMTQDERRALVALLQQELRGFKRL